MTTRIYALMENIKTECDHLYATDINNWSTDQGASLLNLRSIIAYSQINLSMHGQLPDPNELTRSLHDFTQNTRKDEEMVDVIDSISHDVKEIINEL